MTAVMERPLEPSEHEAAGIVSGMRRARGFVIVGPKRAVYVARCESSRQFYAGWWVKAGEVVELVRTERQGRKLARRWATVGFPSEE